MVNWSLEGDCGWFKGEVVKFEFNLELSAGVWGSFRSTEEDGPVEIIGVDDIVSVCNKTYYF